MPISYLFFFSLLLITRMEYLDPVHAQCLEDQQTLLLQLKSELIFDYSYSRKLVRWNQTNDCCSWAGVKCDGAGHVMSLKLDDEAISGGINESSSLFGLRYMKKLNLASNDFNNTQIPDGIQHLTYLTDVDLWNAAFGGPIPPTLGNLTELVYLNLGANYLTGSLSYLHFEALSNLAYFNLMENSVSGSIPHSLFALPSLLSLSLASNQFHGEINVSPLINISNIAFLELTDNSLSGSIHFFPCCMPSLEHLLLSYNQFSGHVPSSLFSLPSLRSLHLSDNQFSGQVDEFHIVNISNLVELDLSNNRLEGPIPNSFFRLQSLHTLLLSDNFFNGSFQLQKIHSFTNLENLGLSYNNLTVDATNVGSSSYRFPHLSSLYLSSCNLYSFPDFMKQSPLMSLDLSNNRIAGEIPSWVWEIGNRTTLLELNLSCNLLVDLQKPYHIPDSLSMLDLHSNMLRGELPLIPFTYADLSDNNFDKSIPHDFGNVPHRRYVSLAKNNLSGAIPISLCNAVELLVLDLSFNHLSGTIPPCLFKNLTQLGVFNVAGNNISGDIPYTFPDSCRLQTLDLNGNSLGGRIPKSLGLCKQLEVMNVGSNNIDDSFPCMLSPSLRLLVLRSNRFHGEIKCYRSWPSLQIIDIASNNFSGSLHSINFSSWRGMMLQNDSQIHLGYRRSDYLSNYYLDEVTLVIKGLGLKLPKIRLDFTTIDFSCNNFHGEIPDAIGDLRSLYLLNLSHNSLTGTIPTSCGNLTQLGSLDLSMNQLRGTIPEELARLTFLSVLNLSYNKLVGVIPSGRQFQTFSADSFQGNAGLCGFPLNISCKTSDDNSDLSPPEAKNLGQIEWKYVSTALGYVVGLGSIVWLLLFCRSFREKYFDKVEEVVEQIFVARNSRRKLARRRVMRTR